MDLNFILWKDLKVVAVYEGHFEEGLIAIIEWEHHHIIGCSSSWCGSIDVQILSEEVHRFLPKNIKIFEWHTVPWYNLKGELIE